MKLMVHNNSGSNLVVVLEPIASAYEVVPGSKILVEGDFIQEPANIGEMEIGPNGVISLYLEPDATVSEDGKPAKHAPGW